MYTMLLAILVCVKISEFITRGFLVGTMLGQMCVSISSKSCIRKRLESDQEAPWTAKLSVSAIMRMEY